MWFRRAPARGRHGAIPGVVGPFRGSAPERETRLFHRHQASRIFLCLPHLTGGIAKRGTDLLSEVIIHDDENFERALKRFKKKCEKAGILSDLRKHRHYEKPSERRKRKMNTAIRKNRRTRHPS